MQFKTADTIDKTEITKSGTKVSEEASKERNAVGQALRDLQEGNYLMFDPESKTDAKGNEKKETIRGMKLKISRAAKEAGVTDLQYGTHKSGALAVWRDASATKRTRKPKDGAETVQSDSAPKAAPVPSAPKVAVPA